jgi:hypothetical protein
MSEKYIFARGLVFECHELLSSFDFKLNLRRYTTVGYGDLYPRSVIGYLVNGSSMMCGRAVQVDSINTRVESA